MLQSALVILLDNAAKFSPARSEIRVWSERVYGSVLFHVSDRGSGVPEEHRERIFDRFYQVEDSLHHSNPGLGLGLNVAKRIVEAHGGWIGVRPAPGGGSIFSFAIPLPVTIENTPQQTLGERIPQHDSRLLPDSTTSSEDHPL